MKLVKAIILTNKYVQGPGILRELGRHTSPLGGKIAVIGGTTALGRTRVIIESSFNERGVSCVFEVFGGECTKEEIDRLTQLSDDAGVQVIVGVGGGKVMDTVKVVADRLKLPLAVVPTIASSDAPCSSISVLYTPDGMMDTFIQVAKNPDLVLVDTEIIATAPARTLVAGMGDALATRFEAEAAAGSFSQNLAGGTTTETALQLSRHCYRVLMEDGLSAKTASERKAVTPSLERVVEANILMSGIGFESSGLAGAHAIFRGFAMLPRAHHLYHGEKVAFCTLVELVLEGRDGETLGEVFRFCKAVGLPTNLDELGLADITGEEFEAVARLACDEGSTIHNIGYDVEPQAVIDAIHVVDELSRRDKFFPGRRPL